MRNAGLEEAQAGFKFDGRNINNLRYADDATLMAESEEELEPLDESEREEWKSWLQKTKIMASGPITSWQIVGKQWQILFWGALKSLQMVTTGMKLKDTYSLEEKLWPT